MQSSSQTKLECSHIVVFLSECWSFLPGFLRLITEVKLGVIKRWGYRVTMTPLSWCVEHAQMSPGLRYGFTQNIIFLILLQDFCFYFYVSFNLGRPTLLFDGALSDLHSGKTRAIPPTPCTQTATCSQGHYKEREKVKTTAQIMVKLLITDFVVNTTFTGAAWKSIEQDTQNIDSNLSNDGLDGFYLTNSSVNFHLRCVQSMGQISWSTSAATAVQSLCSSASVVLISAMLAMMTSKGSPAFQSQIFLTVRLVRDYRCWVREGWGGT